MSENKTHRRLTDGERKRLWLLIEKVQVTNPSTYLTTQEEGEYRALLARWQESREQWLREIIVMPVERRPGVEIARLAPPEERDQVLLTPKPTDVMSPDD
jgi:hypothetical protein